MTSSNRKHLEFKMEDHETQAGTFYQLYSLPDDASLVVDGHIENDVESKAEVASVKTVVHRHIGAPKHYSFDLRAAYRTRILCLANAALHAIAHDPETLNPDHPSIIRKRRAIDKLVKEKMEDLEYLKKEYTDFDAELFHFYYHELPEASGLPAKSLELAEGLYVWQKLTPPVRETHYKTATGLQVTLRETPRHAELTKTQKQEYQNVHKDTQPKWFTALPMWAQKIITALVPKSDAENPQWEPLTKSRPTMLRHIPGEANATRHELIVRDSSGKLISHTTTYRQGVPSSYKMKNKQERRQSAQDNLEQVLNAEAENAAAAFKETWGFAPTDKFSCPVLLSGLLTSSEQADVAATVGDALGITGDDNNSMMAREKSTAVKKIQDMYKQGVEFFDLNVAINQRRKGDTASDDTFTNYIFAFRHNMLRELDAIAKSKESKDSTDVIRARKNRVTQITKIADYIDNLQSSASTPGRNKNLMLAAAYNVAARLMGGLSIGNCKSSKDRLNLQLIAAEALLLDFLGQGQNATFSRYDESHDSPARKRYVKRFCELYASGHALWIGHDNSPGCLGIKGENILDDDIVEELQRMQQTSNVVNISKQDTRGVYGASCHAANFNKPGSLWQKYGATIKKYAMYAGLAVSTLIFGACVLSGVLAPVGLVGIPATLTLAYAGLKAKDKHEARKATRRRFAPHMTVEYVPTVSVAPTGNSYKTMPFTPSTEHGAGNSSEVKAELAPVQSSPVCKPANIPTQPKPNGQATPTNTGMGLS